MKRLELLIIENRGKLFYFSRMTSSRRSSSARSLGRSTNDERRGWTEEERIIIPIRSLVI